VRHQGRNIFEVSDEIWEGSEVSQSDQSHLTRPSGAQQIASFECDPLGGDAEFSHSRERVHSQAQTDPRWKRGCPRRRDRVAAGTRSTHGTVDPRI
jgi:hypothetical protein